MKERIKNGVCQLRGHCRTCREDAAWRASVGLPDECGDERGPQMGLGDFVERLAKPIAKALGMKCLDEAGKLRPESPCAKRRNALNRRFHL